MYVCMHFMPEKSRVAAEALNDRDGELKNP